MSRKGELLRTLNQIEDDLNEQLRKVEQLQKVVQTTNEVEFKGPLFGLAEGARYLVAGNNVQHSALRFVETALVDR